MKKIFILFSITAIFLIYFLLFKVIFNIPRKILFENYIYVNNNQLISKIKPIINENKVWQINLSENNIYFFENSKLKYVIPIAYQAPEDKWYQTPTGYFRIGIKKEKHISSLFPVYMNYAVQFYEDFFIHEIPYYLDGKKVESTFSGGCIRLEKEYAEKFFNLAKTGDLVISYKDLKNLKIKEKFKFPVNLEEFYIRQRFNNPIRNRWTFSKNRKIDYIQHSGIDLAPYSDSKDLNVYNIYDGKISRIVKNGEDDHGLGNTVIIEHNFNDRKIYSLYAHLSEINKNLKEGEFIKKGEIIGKVGATGYGCNYWRIGEDGCDKKSALDIHLHFEIKTKPVLESPIDANCFIYKRETKCYGYTPENPENYGYLNPIKFLAIE